jgi:tetratricopeptide (TPR) repeat protein
MALPETAQALLDYGPHLIDILLPGAALLSRIQALSSAHSPCASIVAELQGWLEQRRAAARGLDQDRIFQQTADTLRALSHSHPLLLTLDDLQWIDSASASLFFHLGRQFADKGGRVLILGAYRPEEVALDRPATGSGEQERHPMQKVLAEFRRQYGDVCLDLTAADQVKSRAFVDAYLDSPASPWAPNRLDDEFRAALSARTAGHPLFTIELLRGMQARGELITDRDGAWVPGSTLGWGILPVRVEVVIRERIERLTEEERDLLTVASVEGEVFTAQAVAQVQGLLERDVLQVLSHQLGAHGQRLVREAGEASVPGDRRRLSRYQFAHALFQAYLYDCLSVGERRLLHGEVGAALEGLYSEQTDPLAAALAWHFEVAGELAKAAAYSERAADVAFKACAYETGIEHNQSALRLYRQLGDRAGEARINHFLCSIFHLVGDFVQYNKCHRQALHIYRDLGDNANEASLLTRDGWASLYMGNSARSHASFQTALKICREGGLLGLQANVMGGLGRLYREYIGDFEQARACGEEALRLGREAGTLANEAIGEFNIGFALHYQGDYRGAELHMQRCLMIMYGNHDWLGDGALGRVGVGLNAMALGDYPAALAHLGGARHTFRELREDNTDDDAWAQSALALLHHQLGENQMAREYAARALAIHRKTGYDYRTATALIRLGHALTALKELGEACEVYQEALDLRRQMGQRHLAPEPLAGLARVALLQGDIERALVYSEEILSHLAIGSVDGTDEPLRIYLTCYRVLNANKDPRAEEMLATVHSLLQERAAKIEDKELRRSFLENVVVYREIAEAYARVC